MFSGVVKMIFFTTTGEWKKIASWKRIAMVRKKFFGGNKKIDSFEKQKRTKTQMCFDLRFVFCEKTLNTFLADSKKK